MARSTEIPTADTQQLDAPPREKLKTEPPPRLDDEIKAAEEKLARFSKDRGDLKEAIDQKQRQCEALSELIAHGDLDAMDRDRKLGVKIAGLQRRLDAVVSLMTKLQADLDRLNAERAEQQRLETMGRQAQTANERFVAGEVAIKDFFAGADRCRDAHARVVAIAQELRACGDEASQIALARLSDSHALALAQSGFVLGALDAAPAFAHLFKATRW